MAENSPRASAQGSRRAIVCVPGDTQQGKIPIITATPRAEKSNPDLNPTFRKEARKDDAREEKGEREIG